MKFTYLFKNGDCELLEQHGNVVCSIHSHSFDELTIVLSGTSLHEVESERYPLVPGDVFVIKGNQNHGLVKSSILDLALINYKHDFFETIKNEFKDIPGFQALFVYEPQFRKVNKFKAKLHLNHRQLSSIKKLLDLMKELKTDKLPGYKIAGESIFRLLVVKLCNYYNETDATLSEDLMTVGSVIDFMGNFYANPITLKILAEHAGLPVHTFRRAFKKMTGCTPIDYLIRLRIEKSVEMMEKNSKVRVIDIAMSNGFENSSYFTLKFKEIMGVTPIKYLKKIAK